ncbi:VIT family protein [Caballeronia cordobensis]|uniref:VIT family protein n=1 Tax=Caballeronia cordobensis TaxID=1353886 RepID=A0A158FYJ2_CABCO|nr:VIT1/CCC1 transporter family protein [Caballeronia cordobensis]SAL24852.1 VIT family protein [Caballeronia cordobensis]
MSADEPPQARERERVLDTVDRVSEMCFGLFMALTFVGTVSAATGGEDAGRKMLFTALGCNLAWGLADAVMYLVRTIADRARRHALALAVQRERDAAAGVRALRERVSAALDPFISDADLEAIRKRIAASETLPERARFVRADFLAALAIFIIIVLSTFPVAAPFVIFTHVPTALLISRVLTLAMLFICGFALGGYAGWSGWKAGLSMMALGVLLTMAIIALGG